MQHDVRSAWTVPGRMKGSGIRSSLLYVENTHGADAVAHVLHGLPPSSLPGPNGYLVASYYGVGTLAHIWERYAGIVSPAGDRDVLDAEFRKMGAFIAENTLGTVYKLLLAVIKPDTLLGRLPSIWSTYFESPEVSVSLLEAKRGRCVVQGVPGLPYVGPTASGWIEFAFHRVGATSASVVETSWAAGEVRPRVPTFAISWA
jgi:hypothetical protein